MTYRPPSTDELLDALHGDWRRCLTMSERFPGAASDRAEQRAYDRLVVAIDTHGLSGTPWDPRGAA